MASAAYLAEHLAEVPAIVIPTVIGRHDGSGRPGLFDSVIQAAWSFCLALRARGLGTTWVTAALQDTAKVKEILGIPEHMTEIVLLPVAYTKGTEFKRAPRHPARAITYFDRFGTTTERGPSDELRFEDGPGAIAEVDIAASPATVWSLVSDLNLPARFSNEFVGAEWASDDRGVGAMFHGRNQHPAIGEWTIPCFVDACDEPRAFGWRTSDADNPGARWRFDLEPREGGTRLRFSYVMGPGPSGTTMAITNNPGKETRVLRRRIDEVQRQHAADRRRREAARRSDAMTLRVGIGAAPFRPEAVEFVRQAERLGVDSVWCPEFWAGDAFTPLAYLAALHVHDQAGHGHRAARRPHAGDARHDRAVAPGAVRRTVRPRHRHQRTAGDGGLARRPRSTSPCAAPARPSRSSAPSPPATGSTTTARSTSCPSPAAKAAPSAH